MKMKPFALKALLAIAVVLISMSLNAQPITVTGKITDRDTGEELVGVNINQKGTPHGTLSDIDGNYSILVEKTIYWSYLISVILYKK